MIVLLLLAILLVLLFGAAAVGGDIKLGFIVFISIMAFAVVVIVGIIIHDKIKRKIRQKKARNKFDSNQNNLVNKLKI